LEPDFDERNAGHLCHGKKTLHHQADDDHGQKKFP
jgi:hypothetical protein